VQHYTSLVPEHKPAVTVPEQHPEEILTHTPSMLSTLQVL